MAILVSSRRLSSKIVVGFAGIVVCSLIIYVFPWYLERAGICITGQRPSSGNQFYLHYVKFVSENSMKRKIRFVDFLSVMSAVQYLKPDVILVHGNHEPTGKYWNILKERKYVQFRQRVPPTFVGMRFGERKKIGFPEHSADIAKLDLLMEYGGVVADFDVFFVRGQRIKDILTKKKAISCYGDEDGYNIGFVAAQKDSKFLYAWRRSYNDIYVEDWNFNQAMISKYLSILYRDEVYVADKICNNPHPYSLEDFFDTYGKVNWTNSLAIHTYERFGERPVRKPEDLYGTNLTTHLELFQYIFENRTLPPFDPSFNDEIDPLRDDALFQLEEDATENAKVAAVEVGPDIEH